MTILLGILVVIAKVIGAAFLVGLAAWAARFIYVVTHHSDYPPPTEGGWEPWL